jgi:uncharacterized membrane protein
MSDAVALWLQLVAVALIFAGSIEAAYRCLKPGVFRDRGQGRRREAWLSFARWLAIGLEFTLGADIVRTAITPSWNDIGQLAAVAVIRTFLNYFLDRDMKELGAAKPSRDPSHREAA